MPRIDRRLGERKEPDPPIDIEWSAPAGPRKLFQRSAEVSAPARLVDLSVTGAAVAAPSFPSPVPGMRVTVKVGDVSGEVVVTRIETSQWDDVSIYGVRFADEHSPLTVALREIVGEGRPNPELINTWRAAH